MLNKHKSRNRRSCKILFSSSHRISIYTNSKNIHMKILHSIIMSIKYSYSSPNSKTRGCSMPLLTSTGNNFNLMNQMSPSSNMTKSSTTISPVLSYKYKYYKSNYPNHRSNKCHYRRGHRTQPNTNTSYYSLLINHSYGMNNRCPYDQ
jgi:hypothetical protein